MSRTISAYFDSRTGAQAAYDELLSAGIPSSGLDIHDSAGAASASSSTVGTTASDGGKGFWESLGDLFMPDEDRYTYQEGLRRGGSLLTVTADSADFDTVSDILENAGAVDLDTREAQWRSEGWSGYEATGADAITTSASAGGVRSAAIGTGTAATLGSATRASADRTGYAAAGGLDERADYIPVAEEKLRVGKREVDHGRVRVRSYVVETPVEEDVSLRSETVRVERNAVDRVATGADNLFREQTIEVEARSEEAVVSKEARVVEEVRLNKDVDVRNETIRDSVRRTEVEIDDDRSERTVSDATLTDEERARRRTGI